MKRSEYQNIQKRACEVAQRVFPFIRPEEIEVAGFGLEKPNEFLLCLINLFNQVKTVDKDLGGFCGKLLICLPGLNGQEAPVCPMHHHASSLGEFASKNEAFYVVYGILSIRLASGDYYHLSAGQTVYLPAGTKHALNAGTDEGCVFFEFSDLDRRLDYFDDSRIVRDPEIEEDIPDFVPPAKGFTILGQQGLQLVADIKPGEIV